jgi:hypothetical protein
MEFQYNDGGRSAAGYKGRARDCGTRAIAIATGLPYQQVYDLVLQYAGKEKFGKRKKVKSHPRTGVWQNTLRKIMTDLGWVWEPTMKIGQGCKVHLSAEELPSGRLLVNVSRHYTSVIDGVIHDTFNPCRGETRCVYGYFYKPM